MPLSRLLLVLFLFGLVVASTGMLLSKVIKYSVNDFSYLDSIISLITSPKSLDPVTSPPMSDAKYRLENAHHQHEVLTEQPTLTPALSSHQKAQDHPSPTDAAQIVDPRPTAHQRSKSDIVISGLTFHPLPTPATNAKSRIQGQTLAPKLPVLYPFATGAGGSSANVTFPAETVDIRTSRDVTSATKPVSTRSSSSAGRVEAELLWYLILVLVVSAGSTV